MLGAPSPLAHGAAPRPPHRAAARRRRLRLRRRAARRDGARRARRRLRRHRHEPALRAARVLLRRRTASRRRRPTCSASSRSIFWSLILVVSVKYLTFVMRADNDGEGGILALMALALRVDAARRPHALAHRARALRRRAPLRRRHDHAGDLGAQRGRGPRGRDARASSLRRAADDRDPHRAVPRPAPRHRRRSARSSARSCSSGSSTLAAARASPRSCARPRCCARSIRGYAVRVLRRRTARTASWCSAPSSSCVTGGEALYADMGHFGRRPIRMAWFLVLPALLLNYFGQGALLLRDPGHAVESVLPPGAALGALSRWSRSRPPRPSIASQALISGAFSLTRQAVQLGYLPRVDDRPHVGATEIGQIYVPRSTTRCSSSRIALVLVVPDARARLAAAYGIAVTGTMVITTILAFRVMRAPAGTGACRGPRWSRRRSSSSTSRSSPRTWSRSRTAAGSRSRSAPRSSSS